MSKLKDKLDRLNREKITQDWQAMATEKTFSTKEKLERLVQLHMKKPTGREGEKFSEPVFVEQNIPQKIAAVTRRHFAYPLEQVFGRFPLQGWMTLQPLYLATVASDADFLKVIPQRVVFFDVESSGLAGGTGTIAFMLGFGYFSNQNLEVEIFLLNEIEGEEEFLTTVEEFLQEQDFSAAVTFNGKCFDFPLMETRFILQRKRFPLLKKPHLDFLYPARTLWKNTYDSRRLGFLGEVILGISRSEDIQGSQIPGIFFDYLRDHSTVMMEKVLEHNALDILGLAALVQLGCKYVENASLAPSEGEMLGAAMLHEKFGNLKQADDMYRVLKESASDMNIVSQAVRRLSMLLKKQKFFSEASQMWELLFKFHDRQAYRELSVHYEHRLKEYSKALAYVEKALMDIHLTDHQRQDLEKRCARLRNKLKAFDSDDLYSKKI